MTGLVAASMFAGFGGSSLGYRQAGFRVAYANEINAFAADAYELNGGCRVDRRSVEEVVGAEIVAAVGGTPDVLDGSPPCQDFSTMGARDLEGERAGLYYEFVRLVGEARPRAFVAENVTGLVKGDAKGRHFLPIMGAFAGHGYRAAARILDASWLGVPQRRERVVVIGFRDDLGIDPSDAFPPKAGRQTTLGDALPRAVRLSRDGARDGDEAQYKFRERRTYPAHLPLPTICASGLDANPYVSVRIETRDGEVRPPSVDELRALSGFPEGFEVPAAPSGRESARVARAWKGFGNCVPPPMARAWAGGVAACLDGARSPA